MKKGGDEKNLQNDIAQHDAVARVPLGERKFNLNSRESRVDPVMPVQIKHEYEVEKKRYKYTAKVELNSQSHNTSMSSNSSLWPLAGNNENIEQKPILLNVNTLSSLENNVRMLIETSRSMCAVLTAELEAAKEKYEHDIGRVKKGELSEETDARLESMRIERDTARNYAKSVLAEMKTMKVQLQDDYRKKLLDYQEKTEEKHQRDLAELRCNHVIAMENECNAQIESLRKEYDEKIAESERQMLEMCNEKDRFEKELNEKYKKSVDGIRTRAEAEREKAMQCVCCGEYSKENLVCSKPCAQMW